MLSSEKYKSHLWLYGNKYNYPYKQSIHRNKINKVSLKRNENYSVLI